MLSPQMRWVSKRSIRFAARLGGRLARDDPAEQRVDVRVAQLGFGADRIESGFSEVGARLPDRVGRAVPTDQLREVGVDIEQHPVSFRIGQRRVAGGRSNRVGGLDDRRRPSDRSHRRAMLECVLDSVSDLGDAFPLRGDGRDHRDAELYRQSLDVELDPSLGGGVHHVERDDHRDAGLGDL